MIGASQVWGAVMVSALTTVVVFAPILVMDLVVGQLFRDIAVALSVAVLLSLIVSITVIPALANRLLTERVTRRDRRLPLPGIDASARLLVRAITGYTRIVISNRILSVAVVVLVCGVTGVATWQFLPQKGYLPEGNRNLIIGIAVPPPGYNLETMTEIARETEGKVKHLWRTEVTESSADPADPICQPAQWCGCAPAARQYPAGW